MNATPTATPTALLDRPLAWAPHLPMVLSEVEVVDVERLSPAFVRLTLAGPGLGEAGLVNDGPWLDQRFKLIVPHDSGAITGVEDADPTWLSTWAERPVSERGHMRTYTVRALTGTGDTARLVVDIVLHAAPTQGGEHDLGPGARWAQEAEVGSRAVVLLPRRGEPFGGIEFLPGDASRLLLVADETAVPAACSILETLPADAVGAAFLEVPTSADALREAGPARVPAGVEVTWLPRDGAARGEAVREAVAAHLGLQASVGAEVEAAEVDPDLWETPHYSSSGEEIGAGAGQSPLAGLYAWIAGESLVVTALRRHLVTELGVDRSQVAFMGYWRRGVSMKS